MPTVKFETMQDAVEHANFLGHTIDAVVAGEACTVEPSDLSPAVAPEQPEVSPASRTLATFVDSATSVVHNFGGSKLRQWQLEQLCKGKKCGKADELLGQIIEIRYVYFHPCEIIDAEDGEISTMIRTVIMTPELDAFGFVSASVATSMMQLYKLFDGKCFEPPVKVRIEQKATRLGRHVYVVDPVLDES